MTSRIANIERQRLRFLDGIIEPRRYPDDLDLDFDLHDHFLPEFPAPIFLTTRPDLGDLSQGKLLTIGNYYELFNGILDPKQLEVCAYR